MLYCTCFLIAELISHYFLHFTFYPLLFITMHIKTKKQKTHSTLILGIETSCDETAAAVVANGRVVLSNIIFSQIDIHAKFGGVVPEVASRNHTLSINAVIDEALKVAGVKASDLDAIAVTHGPGLLGALLVGVSSAKALSYALGKPLIMVNHLEAHVAANYLEFNSEGDKAFLEPPFLSIVASGGHTGILLVESYTGFKQIGGTVDDAIGEAFDKVARLLGLPYPGGPEVDRLAKLGKPTIDFFKTTKGVNKDFTLSYSGLKTAVVNYVNISNMTGKKIVVEDICASFTRQAVDILIETALAAAKKEGVNKIALAGGVAANSYLRQKLLEKCAKSGIETFIPPHILCTDNAAMVAVRAHYSFVEGKDIADLTLNANAGLR